MRGVEVSHRLVRFAPILALAIAALAWLLAGASSTHGSPAPAAPLPVPHPSVSDYAHISSSETPPTQAQCASAGRR
jgi:hypothetical protein